MTDLNTNGLYAVVVPEGHSAEGFYFVHSTSSFGSWELYPQFGGQEKSFIRNTYKEPKIIGLFNELSEEQAEDLGLQGCIIEETRSLAWKDYAADASGYGHPDHDFPLVFSAKKSLQSLLESKGLNPSTHNILLIQKSQDGNI